MRLRCVFMSGIVLLLSGLPLTAAGQDAMALFRQGRAEVEAGRWEAACPLFAGAHRLQKEAIGIVLNLADCQAHVGRLASAWSAYVEAEALAKRAFDLDRAQYAHDKAAALEPRLAKLKIAAVPVPGLQVRHDDQELDRGLYGISFPADAGEHHIAANAPGYRPWSTVVRIAKDGDAVTVQVPALVKEGALGSFRWTPQRAGGLGVGLAGVAAAVAGGVLGGVALSKYDATKTADCSPTRPNVCTSTGLAQRASAGKLADASTGMLIGGGVAAAAGVVVFFTAPAPADLGTRTGGMWRLEAAPVAGVGAAGMLRGEW